MRSDSPSNDVPWYVQMAELFGLHAVNHVESRIPQLAYLYARVAGHFGVMTLERTGVSLTGALNGPFEAAMQTLAGSACDHGGFIDDCVRCRDRYVRIREVAAWSAKRHLHGRVQLRCAACGWYTSRRNREDGNYGACIDCGGNLIIPTPRQYFASGNADA